MKCRCFATDASSASIAAAAVTRDDIIKLMVGREITQMFPKLTVPIGDVMLSVKNLTPRGPLPRHLLRPAHRRDSGRRRPRRLGPQQCRRDPVRRHARDLGNNRHRRRARSPCAIPAMAMDAGMAFLTEDRKETGCFLLLDVMANMQIAVLRSDFVKRRLRSGERASKALPAAEGSGFASALPISRRRSSTSPAAISRRC